MAKLITDIRYTRSTIYNIRKYTLDTMIIINTIIGLKSASE